MNIHVKPMLLAAAAAALLMTGCSIHSTVQPSAPGVIVQPYTPGLATQMKDMQYWTHKLALSIDGGNVELADFYHHELEEAVEDLIASIDTYGGYQIAQLTSAMLVPAMETLEEKLDDEDAPGMRTAFAGVVQACNSCHQVTDHGYIRMTDGFGNNPFNQMFGQ